MSVNSVVGRRQDVSRKKDSFVKYITWEEAVSVQLRCSGKDVQET
jgi:hypothetical protein